jgi:hypothetical protein
MKRKINPPHVRNSEKRVVGRPFPPGVSGNPSGKPRGLIRTIREETRDGAELVEFMLKVFRGQFGRGKLKDRIAAATWLADRSYGKPPIALAVAPPPEQEEKEETEALEKQLEVLSDDELLEIEAILNRPRPNLAEQSHSNQE